jgi:serine/threonine protein kinase
MDKLGKGSLAEVYLAMEKSLGFMCVIKKMSKKHIKELKLE